MGDFSHLSKAGVACMVDISGKQTTVRTATVHGAVQVSPRCLDELSAAGANEIIATARIAAIQASKHTATLIPLCHQVALSSVNVAIDLARTSHTFEVRVTTSTEASTGVEMEALTAATVAALTIYDMVKAVDPKAILGPFALEQKTGGRSGPWTRCDD